MSPEIAGEFTQTFHSLAAELSASDLDRFLHATSLIEVPAGRKLIKARMPVDSIYLVLSGRLDVFAESKEGAIKVSEIGPGEWVGEISVLSGDDRASATVSTATDVRLLRLRHQAFENLIIGEGELPVLMLQHLVLLMSARLSKLVEMLSKLILDRSVVSRGSETEPAGIDGRDRAAYWPECRLADASASFRGFLHTLPGVESFSAADLEMLYNAVKLTLYPAGHVFTLQGQRGDSIFVVVDGAVSQRTHNPVANTVSEAVLNVGEWFALTSLAKELPEFSTASAIKPVFVASLTRDSFNRLFDESSAIARFVLYMLVKELARKVQSTLMSILAVSVESR